MENIIFKWGIGARQITKVIKDYDKTRLELDSKTNRYCANTDSATI